MIKIYKSNEWNAQSISQRKTPLSADVKKAAEDIVNDVKARGDKALYEYTAKFDKVSLDSLEVTDAEIEEAMNEVSPEFIRILKTAKANIERFHKMQLRDGFRIYDDGIILGQVITPLAKVGVYVPGGTASYPSTVLMDTVPAKIAGVGEIIMVTPPSKSGKVASPILAAAKIAGVDRIFKIGGAQAIGALAYSTESVPAVDKIVGPGNMFVAAAKTLVSGIVGIDMVAGPSEILVIADESASPFVVAGDLLSQAEHDRSAAAILVTTSEELAKRVSAELEVQLEALPRNEITRESIDSASAIIVVDNIDEAIEISNSIAPEHLEICLDNAMDYLPKIKNAGSIFLGHNTPEALGDYYAGTNHTLPTNSTARFYSPLSVDDFIKKSSYISYSYEALERVKDDIEYFAEAEGLSAHARSVTNRFKKGSN
ncbi:MAG: histidinol dehydrogenase [Clostridiales bacterium]|nr:histidinol dehydrogenase [Clostridiales bacterium]